MSRAAFHRMGGRVGGPMGGRAGAWLALAAALHLAACANVATRYEPRVVARGELVLRYNGRFEMHAEGRRVANGLLWGGLTDYVDCVPEAAKHARRAENSGSAAIVLSALGGSFGVLGLGGLAGFGANDGKDLAAWLGAGVGTAVLGVILASIGRHEKNRANGAAIDAMNFYNDAVGSLGATCDDLRYPPPVPAPAQP